jgi:hypothetical protein
MEIRPKGPEAAKLRQRKHELVRKFHLPEGLLPGSLALTHRRCGKSNCHCASGKGHPVWLLTFSFRGKKRVERIPDEWVEEVKEMVDGGRELKDAMVEVLAANAELLALWRREQGM